MMEQCKLTRHQSDLRQLNVGELHIDDNSVHIIRIALRRINVSEEHSSL